VERYEDSNRLCYVRGPEGASSTWRSRSAEGSGRPPTRSPALVVVPGHDSLTEHRFCYCATAVVQARRFLALALDEHRQSTQARRSLSHPWESSTLLVWRRCSRSSSEATARQGLTTPLLLPPSDSAAKRSPSGPRERVGAPTPSAVSQILLAPPRSRAIALGRASGGRQRTRGFSAVGHAARGSPLGSSKRRQGRHAHGPPQVIRQRPKSSVHYRDSPAR
jgi:hypothetical protein